MNNQHHYSLHLDWTGNTGEGTRDYQSYLRSYVISINNKPDIRGSSDPAFRGDPLLHNPEELFVASLSACHMLWYLHLCAAAGIIVDRYEDRATGIMNEGEDGKGGCFVEVVLHPQVTIRNNSLEQEALELHHQANKRCFIANSCNFPVTHQPSIAYTDTSISK